MKKAKFKYQPTADFKAKIAKIKGPRNWEEEKANNPLVRKSENQGYKKELTYEEWKSLGPKEATEYIAERLFLPPDKKKKLENILNHEWKKNEPEKL